FIALVLSAGTGFAQYDGAWSGTTSQNKSISFNVASNAFTSLSFGGQISGAGCSANFEVTVTYSTPRAISGNTISLVSTTSAPGAVSHNVSGTFTSATTAGGTISFTLNSIPGVASCSGSGSATWSATRSGGSAPPCSYSISPQQNTSVPPSGTNGSVTVTGSPSGCAGNWTASSGASWLTITSGGGGSGAGPSTVNYLVAPNGTGSQRTGTLTIAGNPFTVTQLAATPTLTLSHVLAVIGSTPGNFGSFFKTSVQLHNRTSAPISGRLVYHPAGTSGTSSDPFLGYSLAPGQTIDYTDLLPAMGLGGLGTMDVMATAGQAPHIVARIYNDAGAAGTTGMSIEAIAVNDVLQAGDEGLILAPIDPLNTRLNIGVRTLSEGVSVMVRVIDRSGMTRTTLSKSYPGTFFEQVSSASFTGLTLNASDTIIISLNSGRAVFYGAATDNTTQDPSIQIARPEF
ncbi:MAG TPA: BACON domain-containing carbohydrate-binding protein, partial [Thermoanaerobaculia bacterium]|nr:BACON domain-containing carbohydrate-binding protein [Thermoanaerobaculia bacterium]